MPATIAKAFIPRILSNVTVSQIRDAFAAKQIGKVKNIDIHRRKNEKNNQYSFAFIDLTLYDTKEATDLCEAILDNGYAKVFYDRKNYWEVKAFLTRSERATASTATSTPTTVEPAFAKKKGVQELQSIPAPLMESKESGDNLSQDKSVEPSSNEDEEIMDIREKLQISPISMDQSWLKVSMHSQLLHAIHSREMEQSTCKNCGDSSNPECTSSIFWKTYAFCSDKCQWELESDIRKSWHKSQQHSTLVVPTFQLDMNDDTTASKFIALFERIQDEAIQEMNNIQALYRELIQRPSVFTKEDRAEMAREYEALEKEIIA